MIQLPQNKLKILAIGGSAGSFPIISKLLEQLPPDFRLPVVMCLHRLKDKREGFKEALEIKSALPVVEPDDKDFIKPGYVYIAPANYHLLVESTEHFSLSTTELVQYSRPSIDVLFESVADIFQDQAIALLLSGANRDGGRGMKKIHEKGGITMVQDPNDSSMSTMPQAAIEATNVDYVLKVEQLKDAMLLIHQAV